MPIEKHMLQTHSLFEKAGEVFEGVAKLKERIAELEKENESLKYSVADLETDLAMSQRWRKFCEEKPEEKQWVLVFVENPSKYGTYVELRRWDPGLKFDVEDQELYTKWKPLPSAPKEGE